MNRRGVGYDVGTLFSGPGWRVSTRLSSAGSCGPG